MKKLIYSVPLIAMLAGCGQVDSDEVGFKTWWGKIDTPALGPGLYFVCPCAGKMWHYSIRDIRRDIRMETYTKDIQTAEFVISVIHTIDPTKVTELHTKYGPNYANVLIEPAIAAATKDVIGQWEADKLVNGREQAAKSIYDKVVALLADRPITVKAVVLSNCDFSDVFERSIEAKVVAMQEAIKAKNKTVQVEEEARQRLILAESEAKAMTIKGNALKENPGLVALEAVQKWDGKAPQTLVVGSDTNTMLPLK